MSIFSKNKRNMIPPNATFRITQAGEEELQKFLEGDAHAVLVALQTNGTSTVEDIAERSGLGKGDVERLIPRMVNKQQIQLIAGGVGSPSMEEV